MAGAVRELVAKFKIKIDQASISAANKALQGVKKKAEDVAKSNPKVKAAVDAAAASSTLARIKAELNALNGKVTTAFVKVKQQGQKVGASLKQGVPKAGKALADNGGTIAATGTAMLAPLALPIKTAMDFEAAMSKVKAITNSSDADMARLTDTARELGKTTQFSASESAAAMSYLGMAGWKTDQIIAGMPGLLDLAAASGEDLARVSDIVSDDLKAFKVPAEQAGHMADVMAAASTNANTNVAMMGETFKYAGAIAGQLGYSLEDVAGATGLMANSGIKAEMAGTALRAIMTRMIDPPKEAATALEQLGVTATNADGTVKPFRQQLQELRTAMKGLTDAQRTELAGSIAGTEAMGGFLSVIGASDADFAKMFNAVDNADGAAAKMAATMNDNAMGALKTLKSAIEDVSITIGDTFLASVRGGMEVLTGFTRAVGDFAKEHPQLVGGILAFVAGAGSLLVILGSIGIALSAVSTAATAIGSVFSTLIGIVKTVLITLSTGFAPVLAIILAVVSVIVLLKTHWDDVVKWFAPGIESMKEGLAQLASAWENIQPFITALMPLLEKIASLIGGVIVGAISLLFRAASWAFMQIAGFINWVTGLLSGFAGVIQWVSDLLGGLIDKAMNFIGLKSEIAGVNTAVTQGIAQRALAGGNTTSQSQSNTFNLTNPNQFAAASASTQTFFSYS